LLEIKPGYCLSDQTTEHNNFRHIHQERSGLIIWPKHLNRLYSFSGPAHLGIIGNGQTIFNNLTINAPSVVPLPAALPLYGTGLAIMGFVGWRRKRKLAV